MSSNGKLFIISAPSGAGKTTLSRSVLKNLSCMVESISYTTRPIRPKEKEGVDYHFVSKETFQAMKEKGVFVESAEVHGNLYGTDGRFIKRSIQEGKDVILNVDIQGAANLKKIYPNAVTIFIHTPSFEELKKRLLQRQSDSQQSIEKRLKEAETEMDASSSYQYQVVNDDFEKAKEQLLRIIEKNRQKK